MTQESPAIEPSPRHKVNKELITLARESRGKSQSDLAELIGVRQGTISKYESGMIDVSDEDLEKLSSVLEYPKDFFFLPDTAEGFGTACLYHRKRQSLPVR